MFFITEKTKPTFISATNSADAECSCDHSKTLSYATDKFTDNRRKQRTLLWFYWRLYSCSTLSFCPYVSCGLAKRCTKKPAYSIMIWPVRLIQSVQTGKYGSGFIKVVIKSSNWRLAIYKMFHLVKIISFAWSNDFHCLMVLAANIQTCVSASHTSELRWNIHSVCLTIRITYRYYRFDNRDSFLKIFMQPTYLRAGTPL